MSIPIVMGIVSAIRGGRIKEMHHVKHLRGDLHVHTAKEVCETHLGLIIKEFDEACGHVPLTDAVADARDIAGMSFLGITNHSSSPLDSDPNREEANERVRRMIKAIRDFCRKPRGIEIYAGAEVNILPDGRLDVDDEPLEQLDFVVASMHYLEDLDPETIQQNYLGALQHPHVKVIGHMNRHIDAVDSGKWETLVAAAAHYGCALEFNVAAQMTDELINLVRKHKVFITLGSDAHRSDMTRDYVSHLIGPKMDPAFLGNALKRLSKIHRKYIVNFWEPEQVREWIKS